MSLSVAELKGMQYIAVVHHIDDNLEYEYTTKGNNLDPFKKASHIMPALKEFPIVYDLGMDWHGHGFPDGSGPMELFPEYTYEPQQFMYREGFHLDGEDSLSECQELPNSEHLTGGFDVPKTGSIFRWRPTKLPINSPS